MRLAVITEMGETPIVSDELSQEIERRLPPVTRFAVRGPLRKAIAQLAMDVKKQTIGLGPRHQ